ncbi:MAG: glycosyltransferase family 39 protein, partial [Anaerolineales bacterium]
MTDEPAANNEAAPAVRRNLNRKLSDILPGNIENLLAVMMLALAVITRLYGLGDRAVSHDEVNHFVPAYELSQGTQYHFDPMTHGPLQMHLIALSFITFGDNDFTARLPAALFSIATVGIALFLFRRYLGRAGALIAGLLFLISPYMLYYGRYQRNEAFIVIWVLLTIYAILRYLERGESGVLILFTVVNALHFTDKATGFIFAGGQMIFLVIYLLVLIFRNAGLKVVVKLQFLVSLLMAAVSLGVGAFMLWAAFAEENPAASVLPGAVVTAVGLGILAFGIWLIWQAAGAIIRKERTFDLIILLGTLVLPLTGAVWMVSIGRLFNAPAPITLNFSGASSLRMLLDPDVGYLDMLIDASLYILIPTAAAIIIGLLWNRRQWPMLALIFFGIFAFFFTTVLTAPGGFFDGLVRYLGYWIVQHGEERASQPWFYYLLIQIPIYEYLPALGALGAFCVAIRRRLFSADPEKPFQPPAAAENGDGRSVPTVALILYWALFSFAIFSYAGEKMPQQTMLIAAPMILAAAWAGGYLLETGAVRIILRPLGWIVGIPSRIAGWFGNTLTPVPWAERVSAWAIDIPRNAVQAVRTVTLGVCILLAVLTARTAYFATYINYDYPNEYMAYAHGAPGPNIALREIERLSQLTTGGTDLVVAYDNYVRYPYWWSLRHYPNALDFNENPTSEIRRAAVVVVGSQNDGKVAPILGEDYVSFTGMRMWWHNQDYFNLKWDYINSEYLSEERENGVDESSPMAPADYLRLVWANHISPILLNP